MTAGWSLTHGEIQKYFVSENEFWASFNYVFSDACAKRSSYKFGFIKAILDNLFSASITERGVELSYDVLFRKFAESYWNLVTKYHLKQMRGSTSSEKSKLEQILSDVIKLRAITDLDYDVLSAEDKTVVIQRVSKECRRNVVGALYSDFDGILYGFDLKQDGIWLNPVAYEFMVKYKLAIERLNYYSWAKFLEKINSDEALVKVIDKLELSTPKRKDLTVYRRILQEEFETSNCFYCGRKIQRASHVDHVIPWSYVKADHLWNFVLACPECNSSKHDRIPDREGLAKLILRNEKLIHIKNPIIRKEFQGYTPDLMWKIWDYAKLGGIKVYKR